MRLGLEVVVYEQSDRIGGVWVYREDVEDDLLGQRPAQAIHGSLYASLRTNLPREVMAFSDFPFDADRQFPDHDRVLDYLEAFARMNHLQHVIRFGTPVERVGVAGNSRWQVTTGGREEVFDAVMVCNGHYSRPRLPALPGMDSFPGVLMHSHNYRRPAQFAGRRAVLLGCGASGTDLAHEIREHAKKVYWCAAAFHGVSDDAGVEKRAAPVALKSDGTVRLTDGSSIVGVDAVVFCTGYFYAFPFLEDGIVAVDDNWVHPLYLDLVPPAHPTIAFVGLPQKIIPFPLFEMQAKWFLGRVAGRFAFPARSEMEHAVATREQELTAEGRARRHFHIMGGDQFAYMNRLAAESGAEPLPDWFEPMARKAQELRREFPETYRDIPVPMNFSEGS